MAKDIYHQLVRSALEKEGWKITHDSYPLRSFGVNGEIDLGAEKLIAAEREENNKLLKIAVEIKSFLGHSFMKDFHLAVGQYINYHILLSQIEEDRTLFLALPENTYNQHFQVEGIQMIVETTKMNLLVFDIITKSITKWTNENNMHNS